MSIVWAAVIVIALFLLAGFVLVEERAREKNKQIRWLIDHFNEQNPKKRRQR